MQVCGRPRRVQGTRSVPPEHHHDQMGGVEGSDGHATSDEPL